MQLTFGDRRRLTSTASYAVTNRTIFQCRHRHGSRRSLISRRPSRLASRCLLPFFWLPTKSSNSRADVSSWPKADLKQGRAEVRYGGACPSARWKWLDRTRDHRGAARVDGSRPDQLLSCRNAGKPRMSRARASFGESQLTPACIPRARESSTSGTAT